MSTHQSYNNYNDDKKIDCRISLIDKEIIPESRILQSNIDTQIETKNETYMIYFIK